jgi:hypothetical protein
MLNSYYYFLLKITHKVRLNYSQGDSKSPYEYKCGVNMITNLRSSSKYDAAGNLKEKMTITLVLKCGLIY